MSFITWVGTNNTIRIAAQEFKVKKSVIEIRKSLATKARNNMAGIANAQIINQDIRKVRISDASVLLFWFTNPRIIGQMIKRFEIELSDGARVITLWSPLELMVPTRLNSHSLYAKSRLTTQKTYQNKLKQFMVPLVSILMLHGC